MNIDDFVNVAVRLKPRKNKHLSESLKVISKNPVILFSTDKHQTFNFDKIFDADSTQEDVYKNIVKPLVEKVKGGYNCTIFAYGQTGTGKTYTMGTNPEEKDVGIVSRALEDFFSCNDDNLEYDVHVSFIEIYNEKVFNLLTHDKIPLSVNGLRVAGMSSEKVFNVYEAKHFLEMGGKNRHTAETKQNMSSSRSHAIFSIHFTVNHGEKQTYAKLNLVDLAGSESVKKTGTQGNSFQEGININKGLLCIGQVMTALTTNLSYVPYRQSIITTILQDSLNKNNYISLIACVKTGIEDSSESVQTLEFAQRVKRMKNKPEINKVLLKYKTENPALFEKSNRISSTPLKRIHENSIRTALDSWNMTPFKKPKSDCFSVPHSNQFENSGSSFSTVNSETGTNFSPVFRKYMSEFETTMLDKLKTYIENTIKRPTRRSTRLSEANNKENTPKYSWNQIQPKISQLIQSEVLQLTTKISKNTSPAEQLEYSKAKRVLDYSDTTHSNDDLTISKIYPLEKDEKSPYFSPKKVSSPKNDNIEEVAANFTFKKPCTPFKIKKSKLQIAPRRSTRLSMNTRDLKKTSPVLEKRVKDLHSKECICKHKSVIATPKRKGKTNKNDKKKSNSRANDVLNILNNGNKQDIQKLSTIGPKTAERILLFRNIKGGFRSIAELENMPGWSKTLFGKFLEQNFLTI